MNKSGTHSPDNLLTVAEIAGLLRVKPSWVYEHAEELGGFRLGKYHRFSLPRVMDRLERGEISRSAVGSSTQRPASTTRKKDGSNGQGTDEEQKALDSEV